MASLSNKYTINGLIDTSTNSLRKLETVTNSCNTWLSYDTTVGKWAVVINQPGNSVKLFDDSNILGPVNLTTNSLDDFYNSCEVRFHNILLRDQADYVTLEIPAGQRLPNEPVNKLIINAPLVNNQIQAQLLGLIELKQSRLDKIVEFQTDYSSIGLEAGNIISLTNSVYGWTEKLFRILRLEQREEGGVIVINVIAQEYDVNIYDTSDLYEYYREKEDGIIQLNPFKEAAVITPDTAVVDENGDSMLGLLGANALIALLKGLLEDGDTSPGSVYDELFNTLATDTGSDIRQGELPGTYGTLSYVAAQGNFTANCPQTAATTFYTMGTEPFVLSPDMPGPQTFFVSVICDQNSSGAFGGRGTKFGEPADKIAFNIGVLENGIGIEQEGSGGIGALGWTDFGIGLVFTGWPGQSYELVFQGLNYTESSPAATMNATFNWSVTSTAF